MESGLNETFIYYSTVTNIMQEEQYSRRTFLKWGTVGLAGATGLGVLVNALYKMDRVSTELGKQVLTSSGTVLDKRFVKGGHFNPMDDLNPMSDFNPVKQSLKYPDEYRVSIKYTHGTVTVNDRELYDQVERGTKVTVQFREAFNVTRTYEGELLERKLEGYKVKKVSIE